jgi:hypothetical protein
MHNHVKNMGLESGIFMYKKLFDLCQIFDLMITVSHKKSNFIDVEFPNFQILRKTFLYFQAAVSAQLAV